MEIVKMEKERQIIDDLIELCNKHNIEIFGEYRDLIVIRFTDTFHEIYTNEINKNGVKDY
jgi:hypothetical protein